MSASPRRGAREAADTTTSAGRREIGQAFHYVSTRVIQRRRTSGI